MGAYYRSPLGGDLATDIDRAIEAIHDGRSGVVLGILCALRDGPYPIVPLTVAVRICGCGQFLGAQEWSGDKAHKGEMHTITHGMCGYCEQEIAGRGAEEKRERA